jgi:transposase
MALDVGIDLHANNRVVVVLDEQDRVVYQQRLPTSLEHMLQQLSPYQAAIQGLGVASTYNGYRLVEGLRKAGCRVHLANTEAIQPYEGRKYANDHADARWLAHRLRLGLVTEGYMPHR